MGEGMEKRYGKDSRATLFSIPADPDGDFEDSLRRELQKWAQENHYEFEIPYEGKLRNLSDTHLQTFTNRDVSIVRFAQTYRDLPILGDSGRIALVVADKTDVVKITGQFVDEGPGYRGLENRLSRIEVTDAMRRLWAEQIFSGEVFIRDLQEVAIPERSAIAYVAEVSTPLFTSSREIQGTIVVEAETGDLVGIFNRPAEAAIRGFELGDDPFTDSLVVHENLSATRIGNTVHFEDHPTLICEPASWVDIRMGDSNRLTVLSYAGTKGAEVHNFTVGRCSSGCPRRGVSRRFGPGWRCPAYDLRARPDGEDPEVPRGHRPADGGTHHTWDNASIFLESPSRSSRHRPPRTPLLSWSIQILIGSEIRLPLAFLRTADYRNQTRRFSEYRSRTPWSLFAAIRMAMLSTATIPTPAPPSSIFHSWALGRRCRFRRARSSTRSATTTIASIPIQQAVKRPARSWLNCSRSFSTKTLSRTQLSADRSIHWRLQPLPSDRPLCGAGRPSQLHPRRRSDAKSIEVEDPNNGGYTVKAFTQAYWSLLFGVSCSGGGRKSPVLGPQQPPGGLRRSLGWRRCCSHYK